MHANCMQIARKNCNLKLIVRGYRETESQIKAPNVVSLEGVAHRKVRKDRKEQSQCRTQMTRIGRINTDNILSKKSINRTFPNEPQRTQRSQRFFKHISVSSVHSVVLTCRTGSMFDPCASASSVQSAFHHVCSSLKNPASGTKVSAFIRVHLRFFKNVIFQTGLTGSTGYVFNPAYPIILSNLKCRTHAPEQKEKLLERAGDVGEINAVIRADRRYEE